MVAVETTTGTIGFDRTGDRRHKVGERFAGAGACLHRQVLAGVERLRDGLGHRNLAAPLAASQSVDGGGQKLGHRGGWRDSSSTGWTAGIMPGRDRRLAAGELQTVPRQALQPCGDPCARGREVVGDDGLTVADQRHGERPAGLGGGGRPAGRVDDLLDDGSRRPCQSQRLLVAAAEIPCGCCAFPPASRRPRPACTPCRRSARPIR